MSGNLLISHRWVKGSGDHFDSRNPATNEILWEGNAASKTQIEEAIQAARAATKSWSQTSLEERSHILVKYQKLLEKNQDSLIELLAQETGKPLWESKTEINSMIQKVDISFKAYQERCREYLQPTKTGSLQLKHRPHGVLAVFAPFNFPLHLANGHCVPALLAGNTVILKPSELTPYVSEKMVEYFKEAGVPAGVIQLLQGGPSVGTELSEHQELDGLFFTGSYRVGQLLSLQFAKTPGKILALELGGNNPLVVTDVSNNRDAAIYHTIQSAYLTAGQRCSCARRLIVINNKQNKQFIEHLIKAMHKIQVGPYTQKPEPFMGPVISVEASKKIQKAYEHLITLGATVLVPLKSQEPAFLSPSLLDVTPIKNKPDEEIFGPVLQLSWVNNFEEALQEANNTAYGLCAGILCEKESEFETFYSSIKAGVVNWNRPLTGTSSYAPFGGVGKSGNHRPAAYYSADYCAYPVATSREESLILPEVFSPGLDLSYDKDK